MNWSSGFSARYYLTVVDDATWRDLERYEITGGNVTRAEGDLMQAADLDMTEVPDEAWVRIYLDARQNEDGAHEPLFTGLLTAPSVDWDGIRRSYRVECYSVLKPAADVLLERGWYAPSGMNGAELAARLLSVGPAPITYEESAPALAASIVAEDGETNLSMAQKIMTAIDWRLRIAGDGSISICPKSEEAVASFDALENDIMELAITDTSDWYACPNVFRATSNEQTAVARDDDEASPYSTVSRGREIWMEERNCTLNAGETLADYALRRLKEEQSLGRTISYARRYDPQVTVGDVVRIHHPAQNVDDIFRVTSQQIEFSYGARTSEEAEKV